MGRREMSVRLAPEYQGLEVKVPSLFRCPISLDVMRSPVSLCTGITYERASIQRWLDSGNTTCPATMLPLPSTDLIPNLTLRRLIALWASTAAPASPSSSSPPAPSAVGPTPAAAAAELLRRIASPGADPRPALWKLAAFLSDDDVDEFDKNALARAGGAAETVASVLRRSAAEKDQDANAAAAGLEAAEAAVRVLAAIAASDCIEEENKKRVAAALAADAASTAASLARVLRDASALESRVDAARLAESLLRNAGPGARAAVAGSEALVAELVRLIGPVDGKGGLDKQAVAAGLSCLAAVAATRRSRAEMVRLGAVPAVVRALRADAGPPGQALRVLEAAVGCAEGRAAVCESAATAVPAVVSKMMKGGMGGAEAAVSVLWAVCHRYRDRRAVEAAAACEGGLTRLLLLMQSGCSAATRQMASELLKVFKVNGKGCLAGYDSKTGHIMPF